MTSTFRTAVERLAHAASQGRFCSVIGAGASQDTLDVPDWEKLVVGIAEDQNISFVQELAKSDPIELFQLLERHPDIWNQVRHRFYGRKGTSKATEDWAKAPENKESALFYLAVLSILNTFLKPNRPFSAVTYNLDTLLEEQIQALGHHAVAVADHEVSWEADLQQEASVTDRPRRRRDDRCTVRILHPHGYVLRQSKLEGAEEEIQRLEARTKASLYLQERNDLDRRTLQLRQVVARQGVCRPVIASSDYDELANSPLGPRNILQLETLLSNECLFYGFSMTDPNVRRLTRLASHLSAKGKKGAEEYWDWASHVILLATGTLPSGYDDEISANDLIQWELANSGIVRMCHASFDQYKSFILDLLYKINRGGRFQWPGFPNTTVL